MPEAIAAPPAPPVAKSNASSKVAAPPPSKTAPAPKPEKATDTIPDEPNRDDPFKDAFAEIDKEAGIETDKEDRRNKGEKAKADKPEGETAKANGDVKPDTTKPKEEEPKTNPELRAAYTSLKEKVAKEYEPQLKEIPTLRAKLKELQERDESTTKATQDEIAAVKKRNAELESHIKFVDYEKSTEFKEKFQKPEQDAWGHALRDLKGLTLKITDPQTQEESTREITQADIAYLANLEPGVARKEINRLFPEDKEEVKRHINQIRTLAEKSQEARDKAKADAETHEKTQTEAQRMAQITRAKLWKEKNEELATKYPKWFGKDETDAEGNAVFDKGRAFADLVFAPQDLTPERVELLPPFFKDAVHSAKPFSEETLVKMHAIAANKLANHDRAITKLKAANARIAELEKSLSDYENSGPDRVSVGATRRDPDAPLSADEEFDRLARTGN